MCVPQQMVEALAPDCERAEVNDQMGDIQINPDKSTSTFEQKSWREVGCTSRMVLEWCQEKRIACTILHGSKACEVYPAEGGSLL